MTINRRDFVKGIAATAVAVPAAAAVAYEMVGPAAADFVAEFNNPCAEVDFGWHHRFTGMVVKSVEPIYKTVAPAGYIYTDDGQIWNLADGERHSAEVLGWEIRLEGTTMEGYPVSTRPMAQFTTDDPEIRREMLYHMVKHSTLTFDVGYREDEQQRELDLAWRATKDGIGSVRRA